MTLALSLTLALAALSGDSMPIVDDEPKGIIARSQEDGRPVIWKFVNETPSFEQRKRLPWLATITWRYDGGERNGMPLHDDNQQMIALESALQELVVSPDLCAHAYNRTGNNIKELVYYISDRERFMGLLNVALKSQPKYPIEIDFYEDPEWGDFTALLKRFANAKTKGSDSPANH